MKKGKNQENLLIKMFYLQLHYKLISNSGNLCKSALFSLQGNQPLISFTLQPRPIVFPHRQEGLSSCCSSTFLTKTPSSSFSSYFVAAAAFPGRGSVCYGTRGSLREHDGTDAIKLTFSFSGVAKMLLIGAESHFLPVWGETRPLSQTGFTLQYEPVQDGFI